MKTFILVVFVMVLFVLPMVVFAQDVIPEPEVDPVGWVSVIFSPAIATAVGVVIGFTKIIRNTVNLKGPIAVAVTVVVAFGYSFIQFNSMGLASVILIGAIAGGTSIGGFWLTKQIGKGWNPAGIK